VFRTGNPWTGRFADVRESGFERNPTLRELGFTVGCVLPLASRDRILGTLCVRRRKDAPYLDDEVGFLIQVAHQVTIAVANRACLVPSFFAALRKKFAISIFCPQ
jgi:GAF domain-containing protein